MRILRRSFFKVYGSPDPVEQAKRDLDDFKCVIIQPPSSTWREFMDELGTYYGRTYYKIPDKRRKPRKS